MWNKRDFFSNHLYTFMIGLLAWNGRITDKSFIISEKKKNSVTLLGSLVVQLTNLRTVSRAKMMIYLLQRKKILTIKLLNNET